MNRVCSLRADLVTAHPSLFLRECAETNATCAFFNSFIAAVANLAKQIAGAAPRLAATQYRL
jgi:hypothetical protein